MTKCKRKLLPAEPYEIDALESWFSDLSAEGLHVQKANALFATFIEGEKKRLLFRMEPKQDGIFPALDESKAEERNAQHREKGWSFVCGLNRFYVYAAEEGELTQYCFLYIQNPNSICHKYKENAVDIFINALNALYDSKYDEYFYIKCLTTITECEVLYFYNKKYRKKYWSYKKEFLSTLNIAIFKNSLSNVDFKKIPIHYRLETILLKHKMIFLYMLMKKSYLSLKKSI